MCRFPSGAIGTEKAVNSDLLSSSGDDSETEDGGQRPAEVEKGNGKAPADEEGTTVNHWRPDVDKLNQQPMTKAESGGRGRINNPWQNRYRLHFESESREEMERRKRLAKSKTVDPLPDVSFMKRDSTSLAGQTFKERRWHVYFVESAYTRTYGMVQYVRVGKDWAPGAPGR